MRRIKEMKISEMTNDQATEAIIRIATPISNICDDEGMLEIIDSLGKMGEMNLVTAVGKILPKIATYALKDHKNDLYEIIGALQMKPTAEIGKMNFAETVKAVRDSYDDVLAGFFTDSVRSARKNGRE
jgi:hypothetical protein